MIKIDDTLKRVLSPAEADEIKKRLQIAQMLQSGDSYREIDKKLKTSAATIARVAHHLKPGKPKKIKIKRNKYAFGVS